MKIRVALLLVIWCSLPCLCQSPAKKKAAPSPVKDCNSEQADAWDKGWASGREAGLKAGREAGQLEGVKLVVRLYGVNLGGNDKPLRMKLVTEDFATADSYRLAAAEIVRTHFPDRIAIDPDGQTWLYISGTQLLQPAPGYEVQSIDVSVRAPTIHPVLQGDTTRAYLGEFVFARDGQLLAGYRQEKRIQVVKEMTYKVLSKFLETLQKAPL